MPKKGDRTEKLIAGDPTDPQGMNRLLVAYFEALLIRNYSEETIKKHRLQLNDFIVWCEDRDITRPAQVSRQVVQNYQRHLMRQIDKRGKPYSFRNQYSRVCSIRCWFKWLLKNEHVPYNPAADLDLPRLGQRLPKHVLTQNESEAILSQPDVRDAVGLRDRAILETFYSTGMRRMELCRLQVHDLDNERGVVTIRQGKGKKDRTIPIGKRALAWIEKYLTEVRPDFLVNLGEGALFLTTYGNEFSGSSMSKLVRDYVDLAAIGKTGSCHLFRHTMATLMLEGGADVRYIQAMLGHSNLETTQVYTRVSIRKLQQVHTDTHPAKNDRQ
ncbi:site-specific tyrosine recombinase XerC [Aeoliella sp.]|uniref:site-specific tyrosine recombinase XerC n=1 Tax=Aeoliella sp. TaxID=2795800 RepID=UPI003CCB8BD0